MKNLYIFDIDGTLADSYHRLHWIFPNLGDHDRIDTPEDDDFTPDWDSYHAETYLDAPIWNTIKTLEKLQETSDIQFWTGRTESNREATIKWLCTYINLDVRPYILMRQDDDHRVDIIIKQEMIDNMGTLNYNRLIAVFEDRTKVAAMWRRNDVTCYQVCEGNY